MDIPARMTRLGAIGPGEAPLKQEVESKLKVVRRTFIRSLIDSGIDRFAFQRLSQWFSNRASATANSGLQRDTLAWLPLLQQLHQLRNPRPRRRTATQQFMLDYAGVVDASFLHRHGDGATLSRTQKMNMRYDVAKSLLANQYSHLINGLNKKAGERFDADTNEWNLILDDVSCAKDITQYVPPPCFWLSLAHVSFTELAIPSLMPFTLSSKQLAPMPVVMFPWSLGIPQRMKRVESSSRRESGYPFPQSWLLLTSGKGYTGRQVTGRQAKIGHSGMRMASILEWRVHFWRMQGKPVRPFTMRNLYSVANSVSLQIRC